MSRLHDAPTVDGRALRGDGPGIAALLVLQTWVWVSSGCSPGPRSAPSWGSPSPSRWRRSSRSGSPSTGVAHEYLLAGLSGATAVAAISTLRHRPHPHPVIAADRRPAAALVLQRAAPG